MVITTLVNLINLQQMSRSKKVNGHYEVALGRCAALKAIDPKLDLGFGLTVEKYEADIQAFRDALNAYNTALSLLDGQRTDLIAREKGLVDSTSRVLASRFGRDSQEYQKAGGTRTSERKTVRKGLSPLD